jgi:hypothetical protein
MSTTPRTDAEYLSLDEMDHMSREDGPAFEWADGTKEWWLDGEELTEAEFNVKMKKTIVIDGITYKLVKE